MLEKPVLAFDTSGKTARVAIIDQAGTCLAAREAVSDRHANVLLSMVDEVLRAVGTDPAGLAGIAVGAGPGSFTGLRVGLALAKGLALPFATPLVLVPSLDALAVDLAVFAGSDDPCILVPCIDAGKGEVHARIVARPAGAESAHPSKPGMAELRLTPADLVARLLAESGEGTTLRLGGSGVDRHLGAFASLLGAESLVTPAPGPTGTAIAQLARLRLSQGDTDDLAGAVPRYGRPPDITTPRSPGRW